MAELADAPDLGSGVPDVQVQVLSSALAHEWAMMRPYDESRVVLFVMVPVKIWLRTL